MAMTTNQPQPNRQERSIDNLIRIYTVVVSLAITNGLSRLIVVLPERAIAIESDQVYPFISLLFTIVPFYHGASRYLDVVYVFKERKIVQKSALMIDFVILFTEGLIFFALSSLLSDIHLFFNLLGALLLLDTLWVAWTGFVATTSNADEKGWPKYFYWAFINLVTIVLYALSLYTNLWNTDFRNIIPIVLMVLTIARTIVDYTITWSFYFPD